MRNSWTCVDASVVVRLFTQPNDEVIRRRWRQWRAEGRRLAAPTLLRYEVTNALYRSQLHQLLNPGAVAQALRAAIALPVRLHDDSELHQQAIDVAARFSLPAAYDAHYLALAERLQADFWTADRRLANAVRPALPWVNLVEA